MSNRIELVNDHIRDILIKIIHRQYGIRMGMISITRVKTSPDLHQAKIFISTFQAKTDMVKVLNQDKSRIRKKLADNIKLKYIPDLEFIEDTSLSDADRVEQLLQKVNQKRIVP